MKNLLHRYYLNVLSVLAVLIIGSLSFFSYVQIKQLEKADRLVIQAHEVISVADELLANVSFAENAQRNFLLTKDKSYLVFYQNAVTSINQSIQRLKQLSRDNTLQNARLLFLEELIKEKLTSLNEVSFINKKQGLTAAITHSTSVKNKLLSGNTHKLTTEFVQEQETLLKERRTKALDSIYHAILWVVIANAVSLAIILFCLYLLNRQLTFRSRAEKKLRDSEEELYRLAYYDSLTGLPNRTLVISKLNQLITTLKPNEIFAIILFDIDNFKNINDFLGHATGDELLLSVVERLGQCLHTQEGISRLGGDEFLIVLTNIHEMKNIVETVKKIQHCLAEPFVARAHRLFVTVSVGISVYPNNGLDAKTLIKNANIAMYRAKELGRNNYQFSTPEMSLEVKERAMLDYHLHQALQREEFILLYQPKISLADKKIIGVEALMRWNHPEGQQISPDQFISLAENNGLIVPISEWMLRTACYQMKKWQEMGLPIYNLAINVSIRQFVISDFVASVRNILEETGLEPQMLELEITERILLENSHNNFSTLLTLKGMDIKLTMDDFGTGYSSLNYLRMFAVDKIKIDKSFVQEIQLSNPHSSIINAIIVMAHSLGIVVVAEGVETRIQAEVLKEYHCDEVQGFYYSHPLPAHEIPLLFK